MSEPIVLYVHGNTPNPTKVAIILEELGLPWITKDPPSGIKVEPFISLNPNGRLPALKDPNTGFVLFEVWLGPCWPRLADKWAQSGAIIEYLIKKYDQDARLHYSSEPETFLTQSWLHFQMSGQGPYFGQLAWFKMYHDEVDFLTHSFGFMQLTRYKKNIISAIQRYEKEAKRVCGVIDAHLTKQSTKYLVGDRLTYADLAFVPWFNLLTTYHPDFDYRSEYVVFTSWLDSLNAREAVKKVRAMPVFQPKQ